MALQSLLEIVQKNLKRAERDNDLIYHHDVPAASALPPIAPANLVTSTPPPGFLDPVALIGPNRMIFGDLVGWGAKEAISALPVLSLVQKAN
jgi:programmed cell death 6-interacting protein